MCHHAMSSYQVVHSEVQPRQGPRLSIRKDIWILPSDTIRGSGDGNAIQSSPPLMITCVQVNRTQPRLLGPRGHLAGEPLHLAGWIFQYNFFLSRFVFAFVSRCAQYTVHCTPIRIKMHNCIQNSNYLNLNINEQMNKCTNTNSDTNFDFHLCPGVHTKQGCSPDWYLPFQVHI